MVQYRNPGSQQENNGSNFPACAVPSHYYAQSFFHACLPYNQFYPCTPQAHHEANTKVKKPIQQATCSDIKVKQPSSEMSDEQACFVLLSLASGPQKQKPKSPSILQVDVKKEFVVGKPELLPSSLELSLPSPCSSRSSSSRSSCSPVSHHESMDLSSSMETDMSVDSSSPNDSDSNDCIASMDINRNSVKRLMNLEYLLQTARSQGVIAMECAPSQADNCVMGWKRIIVSDPLKLNHMIRGMVEEDMDGIWKKANGKGCRGLKNPTWGVYDLFRKIGVKPHMRGPHETDPGKSDMFYYKEWIFKNDKSFHQARKRLATGFSCCKGKRPDWRKVKNAKSNITMST
eukprot:766765-Hanusia_phi.AAC.7